LLAERLPTQNIIDKKKERISKVTNDKKVTDEREREQEYEDKYPLRILLYLRPFFSSVYSVAYVIINKTVYVFLHKFECLSLIQYKKFNEYFIAF
jgi:hypothetical protein